ncbi:hypothetical protein QAD02_006591 [Eretmocerus hayati]|uniref:Uncharacterized protein n=1 Tax=Eretmocerus hayati TaxID=131215 RepID=A0ACC2N1A3_9HYME|nr:hypothetical protein QAD02_006591 [Eretmocerus hayati]
MFRYILLGWLSLLIITENQPCEAFSPLVIKDVFKYSAKLYQIVSAGAEGFKGLETESGMTVSSAEIAMKLQNLAMDFQNLGGKLFEKMDFLLDKLSHKTDELFKYINRIARLYKKVIMFYENAKVEDSDEIKEFAKKVTSNSQGELRTMIPEMHETFIDADITGKSILNTIARKNPDLMCKGMRQSSQLLIKVLYEMVTISTVKGLLTILYGYEIKEKYTINEDIGMYLMRMSPYMKKKEIEEVKNLMQHTYDSVKNTMSGASREIWRCDPNTHQRGVTYSNLNDVFQGYLVYQANTHTPLLNFVFPRPTCADMKAVSLKCLSPHCKNEPVERRCRGTLRDCSFVEKELTVCPSPRDSDRRYDSIKLAGTKYAYGHESGTCDGSLDLSTFGPVDYCMCNCESEKNEKPRYFSLQDVTSDVRSNKVITGAKLTRKGYVFYIEIQQAKLGPNGLIIDAPEWNTVHEISNTTLLSDLVSVFHHRKESSIWDNIDDDYPYIDSAEFKDNRWVYAVTYEKNTVYIDDLEASPNEVLTGLRFQQIDNDLRLEIQKTHFDYETGTLNPRLSSWLSNPTTRRDRTEILLTKPDEPVRVSGSQETSNSGTYVRFRMTDLEKDLGQNTVPFIDLQEVTAEPAVPLVGAGIYLRGKDYSGGFLALKLIHMDFTPHLDKIQLNQ